MIKYVIVAWVFIAMSLAAGPAWSCNRCGRFGRSCVSHHVPHVEKAVVVQQPDSIQNFVFNNIAPPGDLSPRGATVYGLSRALEYNSPNPALYLDNAKRSLEVSSEFTAAARGLDSEILQAASIDARGRAVEAAFRALQSQETRGIRATGYRVTIKNGLPEFGEMPEEAPQPRAAIGAGLTCLKCHNKEAAHAPEGIVIDGGAISLEQFALYSRMVNAGTMPPKSNLTEAERAAEVLKLSRLVPAQ